ncbi:MAG: hypothetical protein IPL56_21095 [Saprospiraceae bacterium]|nr:hypothetical protein [Saprospiraceae bacterium]
MKPFSLIGLERIQPLSFEHPVIGIFKYELELMICCPGDSTAYVIKVQMS